MSTRGWKVLGAVNGFGICLLTLCIALLQQRDDPLFGVFIALAVFTALLGGLSLIAAIKARPVVVPPPSTTEQSSLVRGNNNVIEIEDSYSNADNVLLGDDNSLSGRNFTHDPKGLK